MRYENNTEFNGLARDLPSLLWGLLCSAAGLLIDRINPITIYSDLEPSEHLSPTSFSSSTNHKRNILIAITAVTAILTVAALAGGIFAAIAMTGGVAAVPAGIVLFSISSYAVGLQAAMITAFSVAAVTLALTIGFGVSAEKAKDIQTPSSHSDAQDGDSSWSQVSVVEDIDYNAGFDEGFKVFKEGRNCHISEPIDINQYYSKHYWRNKPVFRHGFMTGFHHAEDVSSKGFDDSDDTPLLPNPTYINSYQHGYDNGVSMVQQELKSHDITECSKPEQYFTDAEFKNKSSEFKDGFVDGYNKELNRNRCPPVQPNHFDQPFATGVRSLVDNDAGPRQPLLSPRLSARLEG